MGKFRKTSAIFLTLLLILSTAGCNDSTDISETDKQPESKTENPQGSDMEPEPESDPETVVDTSLHGILKSSDRLVAKSETVAAIPYPDDISKGEQGGYTDGTYHYQFFIKKDKDSNEKNNIVRLVKYDMEKQETVAVSEALYLNHANDLTYNSKENVFVAVHNNPNRKQVSKISPETLKVVETVTIPVKIYSISYNEARDCYVVGLSGGQDFRILRSDFSLEGEIHPATPLTKGYTTQGCTSDDEYIYFVLYKENVITVYDWDGNFVSLIYLDVSGEPENISVVGEDIYVATSAKDKAAVYKLTSFEKVTASAPAQLGE